MYVTHGRSGYIRVFYNRAILQDCEKGYCDIFIVCVLLGVMRSVCRSVHLRYASNNAHESNLGYTTYHKRIGVSWPLNSSRTMDDTQAACQVEKLKIVPMVL